MDESLVKLKVAFAEWRSRKRDVREAIPVELVRRARAVARRHGPAAVYRVTKVDPSRRQERRAESRCETGARGGRRYVLARGTRRL